MKHKIYALLVGIDEYPDPIPSLEGCVNDISAIAEYLEHRVATEDGYQLHMRSLNNQEATRQAIIDNFREHLCQAGSNDVALFYFCGHGSQEPAPPELWHLEPDHHNETVVCWDSRIEGKWDLADKELAKLIAEVAEKNPHILIVLDCCHSGSGTRDDDWEEITVRRAPTDKRQRPIDSFIFSLEEVDTLSRTSSSRSNSTNWLILPEGQHILLAACRDCEKAKEYYFNGKIRGTFSYFLLDTLQRANKAISYRDLFKRTDALVRSKVKDQSPQIEANELHDLAQPFLGGAIAQCNPYFTVTYHKKYGWVIDGGAVHGVPPGTGNENTTLALFPFDSNPQQLRHLSNAKGEAVVIEVLPQLSQVDIRGIENLDRQMTFKAVVINLPLPPVGIYFQGEAAGIELVRLSLQEAGPNRQASLYVCEVETPEQAKVHVLAREGQYLIEDKGLVGDRSLIAPITGYVWQNASQVVQKLEHIARWTKTLELANPAKSRISLDAVQMQIIDLEGREIQNSNIRFEYRYEDGQWKEPTFRLKLKNNSSENLYCTLVDLTETYGVFTNLFPTGGEWLEPGQEVSAYRGRPIPAKVKDKLWEQGCTEFRDFLMLIVSTAEFDARLLAQNDLESAHQTRDVKRGLTYTSKSTLNRLLNRIQIRHLGEEDEDLCDDWVTSQILITTSRPKN